MSPFNEPCDKSKKVPLRVAMQRRCTNRRRLFLESRQVTVVNVSQNRPSFCADDLSSCGRVSYAAVVIARPSASVIQVLPSTDWHRPSQHLLTNKLIRTFDRGFHPCRPNPQPTGRHSRGCPSRRPRSGGEDIQFVCTSTLITYNIIATVHFAG